jgi:hypothetical protein
LINSAAVKPVPMFAAGILLPTRLLLLAQPGGVLLGPQLRRVRVFPPPASGFLAVILPRVLGRGVLPLHGPLPLWWFGPRCTTLRLPPAGLWLLCHLPRVLPVWCPFPVDAPSRRRRRLCVVLVRLALVPLPLLLGLFCPRPCLHHPLILPLLHRLPSRLLLLVGHQPCRRAIRLTPFPYWGLLLLPLVPPSLRWRT